MSEPTPGPWEECAVQNSCDSDGPVIPIEALDENGDVWIGFAASEDVGLETAKANARLMSAAHGLLEACEEVVEAFQNQVSSPSPENASRLVEAINGASSAVAKAKGES